MNIDQIGDLIEGVKSGTSLEDFCRSYDIELLSENVENIKGQSSLYFSYRINSCGHEKTSRIGSIKRSGVTCNEYGGCKDEQLKNKYSELGLDLDFAACSITCNKCNTTYYREQSKLKKFLDKYKCYCELVPSNEYQVYKALQNKFGTELIRSYNKYGIPNKNYSADFYIRKNEVDYIIALDDKSHLGPINQGRDKCKIDIQLTKENTYSIYIEQRILFNSNAVCTHNP